MKGSSSQIELVLTLALLGLVFSVSLAVNAADTLAQWQRRNVPGQGTGAVGYGSGFWVAVGNSGAIITSPDAINWTVQNSATKSQLSDICYGNGLWVAVGSIGTILTSPDGVNWTSRNSQSIQTSLGAIGYGNGQWVAVGGSGLIQTSPDGINWTARTIGKNLSGISHGNGLWVAVGVNGTILTSPDGINWTPRNSGPQPANPFVKLLYDVGYGSGLWLVVGDITVPGIGPSKGGVILTSPDGISWTTQSSGTPTPALFGIGYGNRNWVAVGVWDFGTILTSPDGINWTERSSGTRFGVSGVGYGSGLWVAVTGTGLIFTSGQIVNAPTLSISRSGVNALVAWPIDSTGFVLETTPDLAAPQSWKVMTATPTIVNSQNTVTDALSEAARYYRLRQQ